MANSLIGNLELVSQGRNVANNALVQVVRRPPRSLRARNFDPDDSGDFAVIYTRFIFSAGDDSLLDATNGQILDVRVNTADLERRLDLIDRRQAARPEPLPQPSEEEREQAALEDFRHGVVPDRVPSPVSFLNLTDASGHSTMYVEEQDDYDEEGYHVELSGIAVNTAYDFADSHNIEEAYDRAYTESLFINYSAASPGAANLSPVASTANSSWSHVSPTSVLISRPWPHPHHLPPLPRSADGEHAEFDNNILLEEKAETDADNGRSTPPALITDVLESSFMASMDQRRSPVSEEPGFEIIVPSDPSQSHGDSDLVTRRVGSYSYVDFTEEMDYSLHVNGTVDMPTASDLVLSSPTTSSPTTSSPPSPIPPQTPPIISPSSTPPSSPTYYGPEPNRCPCPGSASRIPQSVTEPPRSPRSPKSPVTIPRPQRFLRSPTTIPRPNIPAPSAPVTIPKPNTPASAPSSSRPTSSSPPASNDPLTSATHRPATQAGISRLQPASAIPIPPRSSVTSGVPGLKRRKLSPNKSSSSSGAEANPAPRRSRRISRKPRRKYSK